MRSALTSLVAAAVLAAPGSAAAVTNGEILTKLNAERAASGIPGGIVENADWSSRCGQHNHYMALNNVLSHPEDAGRPGYTAAGDWAGTHSVLAQGTSWAGGDPWRDAPYHYIQVLDPGLTTTGIADSEGFSCLVTLGDFETGTRRAAPAADTLYSWPGNGTTGPWFQIVRNEFPKAPQEDLSPPIDQGVPTGPNIMLYWAGPDAPLTELQAASVAGPAGVVDAGLVQAAEGAGFLIPRQPLQPGAAYTVSATFATAAGATAPRSFTKTFGFTTGPYVPPEKLVAISAVRQGADVVFDTFAAPPMAGQAGSVVFEYSSGGRVGPRPTLVGGSRWTVTAPATGAVTMRLQSQSFQIGSVAYPATTFAKTYGTPVVTPKPQPKPKPKPKSRKCKKKGKGKTGRKRCPKHKPHAAEHRLERVVR